MSMCAPDAPDAKVLSSTNQVTMKHFDNKTGGTRLPLDVEAKVLSMATCASMHKALLVFRAKCPLTHDLLVNKSNIVDRIVQCSQQWHRKVGGIEASTDTHENPVGGLPKHAKVWCRLRTNAGMLHVVGTVAHCWYPFQYIDSYDGRPKQVGAMGASVNVTDADAANAGFVNKDANKDGDDRDDHDDGDDHDDRSDTDETLAQLHFIVFVVDMLPHVFANNAASAAALFRRVDASRLSGTE